MDGGSEKLMKPLLVMLCFNRLKETKVSLEALSETTDFNAVDVVIFDNGSTDGTGDFLSAWCANRRVELVKSPVNIGCSQGLNFVMKNFGRAGQDVIKIDNDVRILTPGWIDSMSRVFGEFSRQGRRVAMISGYYPEIFTNKRVLGKEFVEGHRLIHYRPAVGAATWYSGKFLGMAGYFDVLAEDHLYGFEDLIMSAKAQVAGWEICAWEGWRVEHSKCGNSLGSARTSAVEKMRPLYEQRIRALQSGGSLLTNSEGAPQGR